MESLKEELLTRPASLSSADAGQPLVSIISFCKDRAPTIRRSIESVLSQSYRNFEFLVQDGASTDGTLEILQSYGDPRIKIVSQKDSGAAEAFWRVLNRCQGDIIGTCLSDEELLPGAIEKAVEFFRINREVGAMTCDGYVTDMQGNIVDEFNAGEFSLVDYLFGWYSPFWPGSFFRRQALVDIGLHRHQWTPECLEFEIWCRLGTQHAVKYVPVRMSKYAVHDKQLSQTKEAFHEHFDNRAQLIRQMFSSEGFFGENEVFLKGCLYNQLYLLYNHVRSYKLADQQKLLAARMHELRASVNLFERVAYLEYFGFLNTHGVGKDRGASAIRQINVMWNRMALSLPASFRKRLPRRLKRMARSSFTAGLFVAYNVRDFARVFLHGFRSRIAGASDDQHTLPEPDFTPVVYHSVAQVYYTRGQIDQALQLWAKTEAMQDPIVDGVACQAMLMSPTATYEELLDAQRRWARRHARPLPALAVHSWKPYDGQRKIRIGYACAFLDSDTVRAIVMPVISERDRGRFEVYAYSPSPVASDVVDEFDGFRKTGTLSDADFVRQVRSDEIDILVELTGFSPQNRFAAMASRCAPVQVSYLNHTGTSGVPKVDYVLTDAVSVLPEEDRYFTEKVWRLPGCFLSYTYDRMEAPAIVEPPHRKNGHVTFACFGSGGKINIRIIELWAQVLHRVPRSVFAIRNGQLNSSHNRQLIQDQFARFGIAPDRLCIQPGTDRPGILQSYNEVDISLDSWPYCGGNSIAEPLWQGVPVVTLKGDRFSSRYGASLMMATGCPELVARNADEYVEISARLAHSPERLEHYRRNLRAMTKQHGLSDARAFARKLEAAYIEMLQRAQR